MPPNTHRVALVPSSALALQVELHPKALAIASTACNMTQSWPLEAAIESWPMERDQAGWQVQTEAHRAVVQVVQQLLPKHFI